METIFPHRERSIHCHSCEQRPGGDVPFNPVITTRTPPCVHFYLMGYKSEQVRTLHLFSRYIESRRWPVIVNQRIKTTPSVNLE